MLHLYFLLFELVPKWNKLNFYILINSFIDFIILVYQKSELIKFIINSLFKILFAIIIHIEFLLS